MSELKATPGEWKAIPCNHGGCLLKRGDGITFCDQPSLQVTPAEDAYLMAASKNMYEALKWADEFIEAYLRDPDNIGLDVEAIGDQIAEAIRKARGET